MMKRRRRCVSAVAGFDFETNILVITDQRVLIIGEKGVNLILNHDDIYQLSRDGRTLIIETRSGIEHRCHFSKDQTVGELVELAGAVGSLEEMEVAPAEEEDAQTTQTHLENENVHPIAERVRFWEEQDKINQELIPRVIRQNELLTKHIAEHDSLPLVAGVAISRLLPKRGKNSGSSTEAASKTDAVNLDESDVFRKRLWPSEVLPKRGKNSGSSTKLPWTPPRERLPNMPGPPARFLPKRGKSRGGSTKLSWTPPT